MKTALSMRQIADMLTGGVCAAAGVWGLLFGIAGNHVAPLVLLIFGHFTLKRFFRERENARIAADAAAAVSSECTGGRRFPVHEGTGTVRELVIDRSNSFVPQRLRRLSMNGSSTGRRWSLERFAGRINELARRALDFLPGLEFADSMRIRLVSCISGAAPPA